MNPIDFGSMMTNLPGMNQHTPKVATGVGIGSLAVGGGLGYLQGKRNAVTEKKKILRLLMEKGMTRDQAEKRIDDLDLDHREKVTGVIKGAVPLGMVAGAIAKHRDFKKYIDAGLGYDQAKYLASGRNHILKGLGIDMVRGISNVALTSGISKLLTKLPKSKKRRRKK